MFSHMDFITIFWGRLEFSEISLIGESVIYTYKIDGIISILLSIIQFYSYAL